MMAHFAKIEDGLVTEVLVVDDEHEADGEEFLNSIGLEGRWVRTSYNTFANVHANGGVPLRKNFAGIGYSYDEVRDAFIPPQPYPSWTLDEDTCQWVPPHPAPEGHFVPVWDEESGDWVIVAWATT